VAFKIQKSMYLHAGGKHYPSTKKIKFLSHESTKQCYFVHFKISPANLVNKNKITRLCGLKEKLLSTLTDLNLRNQY